MEQRHANKDPFAVMVRSRREEIEKYRWIESETGGFDIGWARAEREWKQKHFKAWRESLRARGLVPAFAEVLWSQQEEIERFKWLESERRGQDIGWANAVLEWQNRHYEGWKRHALEQPRTGGGARKFQSPERRQPLSEAHRAKLSASLKAWAARRKATNSE